MSKTIKHKSMLRPRPKKDEPGFNSLQFPCRGCTMIASRVDTWEGFFASMANNPSHQAIDNSYLTLEEEPENYHDPNAVQVVCRGEFFGTVGYVGREFTKQVKDILSKCTSYRVDVVSWEQEVQREIPLILTWSERSENS